MPKGLPAALAELATTLDVPALHWYLRDYDRLETLNTLPLVPTQQVIITQFGNPVGAPVATPGLHFKLPFVQQANYFDKRFLDWDGSPNQVPTKDKRFIWVDTYARWRIVDPLRFFQRLRDERGAQSRLDDILDGETRNAVARYDLKPDPAR